MSLRVVMFGTGIRALGGYSVGASDTVRSLAGASGMADRVRHDG
jgi:hypothetical protein